MSTANLFFALLLYMSLLDTRETEVNTIFTTSNVFHIICITIWTYVAFISCYSVWKVRTYTTAAELSLDRDAENTDITFLKKCCKITHN